MLTPPPSQRFAPIRIPAAQCSPAGNAPGQLIGRLADGEPASALGGVLLDAPEIALTGRARLMCHADLDPGASPPEREQQRKAKLAALEKGRSKRFVLDIDTPAGPRVVKVAEVNSVGNFVHGLLGQSVGRTEHTLHQRAENRGVAATASLGFLEWRAGGRLRRSCQIQSWLPAECESLDTVLKRQLAARGQTGLDDFAAALADTHRVPFFHADLKGFHAFVAPLDGSDGASAPYRLLWIDLARVGFHMSRRRRIINLYQALRFVVPQDDAAQKRFICTYCRAANWHAAHPERVVRVVQRFLAHKYRTHPNP